MVSILWFGVVYFRLPTLRRALHSVVLMLYISEYLPFGTLYICWIDVTGGHLVFLMSPLLAYYGPDQ